ncbi:MAG: hypothetical protein ACLSB9_26820 [Hydrogeniiclostridium mannosilyticum]
MNEAGLAVSVNMIQDSATISQDTGKPNLTTDGYPSAAEPGGGRRRN